MKIVRVVGQDCICLYAEPARARVREYRFLAGEFNTGVFTDYYCYDILPSSSRVCTVRGCMHCSSYIIFRSGTKRWSDLAALTEIFWEILFTLRDKEDERSSRILLLL